MSVDKRKTVEEQLSGMKQTIQYKDLKGKLVQKPKAKCAKPHYALDCGERCQTCGFQKI